MPNPPSYRARGFRFETKWLLEEGCEEIVQEAWEGSMGEPIQTRLTAIARGLVGWNKVGE